jgi:thiosulfate reductase cytochrome b subunit
MCTDCHTAHFVLPHTDERSTIHERNITKTCTRCHARIEQVHRKVIRGELWEKKPHVIPVCVDCHEPHKQRRVFYDQGMADRDCQRCHGKESLAVERGGKSASLFVDKNEVVASVHGKVACSQCHTGGDPTKVRACETITTKVDCSICHAGVVEQYGTSTHGTLSGANDPNGPKCADCHGTHGTKGKKDPTSPTFPRNVPELCALCHREGGKAANRYNGTQHEIVAHYTMSIHGKGLIESGLVVTAMCTDCHTAHHELPASNPASTVHPDNIANTCARCHFGINESFRKSVHSPSFSSADKDLPTCKDCHSSHTITRHDEKDFKLGIMDQCGRCHEDIAKTYFDTYHGKVSSLGYVKTAKCYDCHGAHDILPVTDPTSRLSHANVVETCAKCHPGAHRQFAGYLSHATHHDPVKYPVLYYVFWSMTGLLSGVLLFFGLHTLAWLPRSLQMRRRRVKAAAGAPEKQFLRFTSFDRLMHLTVVLSFFGLVVSGMVLKFSYAGWAGVIARLLGGFESAGTIHRVCALITFGYFFVHVGDIVRRKAKAGVSWRRMIFGENTLLPTKRDGREFIGSLKWFLALGPQPRFGRWTYWEKFDYLAIFWGVPVIGLSGLMLWFPEAFTRVLPGWFINVATIIHSDEALLATSFIFTIHFFNTHFRPQKFPMDTVIFTGRVPVEELKEDRPDEYEALVRSGELEARLVDPMPKAQEIAARIFGTLALAVGLTLVGLIVYSVIFSYR